MALKKGLGRGIDALITVHDEEATDEQGSIRELDINKVEPNREQPRRLFNKEELDELAESIRVYGIISPLVVKKDGDYYSIVAGERRWRAARLAGLKTLPVIIREFDKKETLEVALIENLQRTDLNPMEEAASYKKLIDDFGMTQEDIAVRIGKSRSAVANTLRLNNLPGRVGDLIMNNLISAGHAKVLMGVADAEEQFRLAEIVAEEGLSVRELENRLKEKKEVLQEKKREPADTPVSAEINKIQRELEGALGTRVNIKSGRQGKGGRIEIAYFTQEEFDRLYLILKNKR